MNSPKLAVPFVTRLESRTTKRWSAMAAVFLLVVCLGTARAQSPQVPQTAAESAPQAARMARLTYVTGQVELSAANGGNSQPAVQNVPVLEGALLSTAFDGQAELEFEDGSVVRMTPNTELSVARLCMSAILRSRVGTPLPAS